MPFPLLAAAPAIAQGALGLAQSIFGGNKASKAEGELEALQPPKYTANKSITDYYNMALQRYGINPYQSQQYQYATQAANRNLAAGVGALQDRRSAVGGVSRLTAGANNAALRAGMAAEDEQSRRFGQLQGATGMKAQDDLRQFQFNELAPYEKNYNLLAMKAGAGATQQNAGITNAFGGLGNLSMLAGDYLSNKPYGTNAKAKKSNGATGSW